MAMRTRNDEMREAFEKFHMENPKVWWLFKKFTYELMERGFKHYSVKGIFERIRWETDQADHDGRSTFKINNNYGSFYARMFNDHRRVYFFRTRAMTSRENMPVCRKELGPIDFDGERR